MKTADLELPNPEADKPTRSLGSLFGISDGRKGSRSRGVPEREEPERPQISRSIADVIKILRADGAAKIGIHGDKGFYDSLKTGAGEIECVWLSNDFVIDHHLGALPMTADLLRTCQAIVVGGAEAATKYRLTLRGTLAHAPTVPVHWVADNWEFCAGTLAIPAEVEDADALVFNHFEEFFGLRDPLQFRFDLISEQGTKRSYRVLGARQSVALNLKELAPERDGAVVLKVFVSHPSLTNGRHYRFRMIADVFWRDSFAIVQGAHQFGRNPNREQSLRLSDTVIRGGQAVMTVPNYDLDMGADDAIAVNSGAAGRTQQRVRTRPVETVRFDAREAVGSVRDYFSATYKGYGGSFWYGLEEGCFPKPGKQGSIACNALPSSGGDDRDNAAFRPDELRVVEQAVAAGFMIHPSFLPVMHGRAKLSFGFSHDGSTPSFDHYWLRFYAADGQFLGEMRWRKTATGPAFVEDVLEAWGSAERFRVGAVLVAPDHLKIGAAPQRSATIAAMVVRQIETGDQDVTTLPSSWCNLGTTVPTLPHAQDGALSTMGRTSLIGRVRCRDGYRTGVFIGNASGNLKYDAAADVEIAVVNHAGRRLSHHLTLSAFGSDLVWLDDVAARLKEHVGESGVAALQVLSAGAELTACVVGLSPGGAVGLQRLRGY
jgi:hypothetical protein